MQYCMIILIWNKLNYVLRRNRQNVCLTETRTYDMMLEMGDDCSQDCTTYKWESSHVLAVVNRLK